MYVMMGRTIGGRVAEARRGGSAGGQHVVGVCREGKGGGGVGSSTHFSLIAPSACTI